MRGGEGPVLVVDDDPSVREAVRDALDLVGYEVVEAANGLEALRCLEDAAPFAVLLDLTMPVLDGPGFVRAARERGEAPQVVIMTADPDPHGRCRDLDAVGWLPKPFGLGDLVEAVGRCRGCGKPPPGPRSLRARRTDARWARSVPRPAAPVDRCAPEEDPAWGSLRVPVQSTLPPNM